ncbi:MAG TPA: aldolase/citrate lyase family protein [Methylomusa anaerophila]|uniref:Citrate lyase subunit beta n=1 Tax=Methylomusa anaerophila TaxID=1930071 RepID=A0A348AFY7_9FIRM|nr:aldolase/citrate lyase family protein [Methylomusa anaerophila]BBB89985.1 citrate lyase subunit beta [Methylomusa anaerophila]HML88286.1 aldolase/citrate lyase family protein [Methylomusa anaerophila]
MELRRTMLFMPGNNPGMLQNGGIFGADAVILDLEDAVAPGEKDAARLLVAHALGNVDYGPSEKVIRINPLETFALEDIKMIVPCRPDALLVPKVESVQDIQKVAALIAASETPGQKPVGIVALLETPRGIAEAYPIAQADKRVVALALGAEDYTAGLGAKRTKEGSEIFTARTIVVNSAAAAGIQAIDTPYTDASDRAGLIQDTEFAKQLGFKGKLAINPRQIDDIHSVFNPTEQEIAWAERVIKAIRRAEAEGSGVASLDGKMVDAPIANRAERILHLARLLGMIEEAKG